MINKLKDLFEQIMKFGIVGIIAFIIDYGLMILLTELIGLNYLTSSAISFCISVCFNYLMSILWVFHVDKESGHQGRNFIIFISLSAIGLGLNQILMWLGTNILGLFYMFTKIGATAIVMVYNFVTRKIFLEK